MHELSCRFLTKVKHHFPHRVATPEFLLVDAVNNLDELAEDRVRFLQRVKEGFGAMDRDRLLRAVAEYGNARTRRFFNDELGE